MIIIIYPSNGLVLTAILYKLKHGKTPKRITKTWIIGVVESYILKFGESKLRAHHNELTNCHIPESILSKFKSLGVLL